MIQLNLYDRDYSGADPDPTLITTKSRSGFDFLINNNSDEKSVITFMYLHIATVGLIRKNCFS